MAREPQTETAGTHALGFGVTFVDGRGVLTTENRALEPVGKLDRLAIEIPDLRFPFDLSGGPGRFANKRCRLRELGLSFAPEDLLALVERAPLGDFGIFDPRVELTGGTIRLSARAVVGEREAEITAAGALRRAPKLALRLSFYDVRVYGFLPVPAPLLCAALFAALGAQTDAPTTAPGRAGLRGTDSWVATSPALLRVVGPSDLNRRAGYGAVRVPARVRMATARSARGQAATGRCATGAWC